MKDDFSNEGLLKLCYQIIEVPSLDKNLSSVCQSKLAPVANHSQSQTDGLAKLFRFKKTNRVMLATNVSIDDRLVNGKLVTTVDTKHDSSSILNKIYVKSKDENTGLKKWDQISMHQKIIFFPIVRIEANFSLSLNSGPNIHKFSVFDASICMYSSQSSRLGTAKYQSFFQFK